MKNLFVYAVIAALFFSFPTFGQTVLEGKMNKSVTTHKHVSTELRKSYINGILKRQHDCPKLSAPDTNVCYTGTVTATNCGSDTTFCDNPDCIAKIMFCHEICDTEFINLTTDINGYQYYSQPFTDQQINALIGSNTCVYRYINCKIVIKGNTVYYRMENSDTPLPQGTGQYQNSYSVALLQSIMRSGSILSLTLYKGVDTDYQGNTVYILPVKVEYRYGGGTRYFDVSDTQP